MYVVLWLRAETTSQPCLRHFSIKLPDEPTSELVGYCRMSLRDNYINDPQYVCGPLAAL